MPQGTSAYPTRNLSEYMTQVMQCCYGLHHFPPPIVYPTGWSMASDSPVALALMALMALINSNITSGPSEAESPQAWSLIGNYWISAWFVSQCLSTETSFAMSEFDE